MRLNAWWKKSLVACSLLFVVSPLLARAAEQRGTVQSNGTPIAFSSVTLYRAGNSRNASAVFLGSAQTNAKGGFSIYFSQPLDPSQGSQPVFYLIADGGIPVSARAANLRLGPPIRFATVLGSAPIPAGVVINERTTVATAYAMAQFISGRNISGGSPGLQNAAATMMNLVDPSTGEIGTVLGTAPNGLKTSTMRKFNSLANLLATCVDGASYAPCASLFALSKPQRGAAPRDTLQAAVNIAHNPWQNPRLLFLQATLQSAYEPALSKAPNSWALAVVYEGNGHEFDGPGNMSVDANGNIWITNNYTYNKSPISCAIGSPELLKLTPTGADAPGAPYTGGGLYGAGFGITLDPKGTLWVGNFGFQGADSGVPCDPNPPPTSMSAFGPNGTALSPASGFIQGQIDQPQGTASDQKGNIWIANCGNNSVTEYPSGNPAWAKNFSNIGIDRPFGLAIDGVGNAWVSSSGNNSVVGITPAGKVITGSGIAVGQKPLGIAVDSMGNVWASDSGAVILPCGDKGGLIVPSERPSISEVRVSGERARSKSFTGGGLTVPWGIAVDGDDNIWVANFDGHRLSEFCGARSANCPLGYQTGDPISPKRGYHSDALQRNTGVVIDPSGNVWLANNWLTVPVQTNPGGNGMVEFIGIAAPVKTPVIGPPQRP